MPKSELKIDWATHQAARYACLNWHYSKRMPRFKTVKVGAWENGQFIGVVLFGWGATPDLVKRYGLKMQEGCELRRVALREHKAPVSRIMALAIRFLKRSSPGLRLIVSFADPDQGHHGGIYQATNWVYLGTSGPSTIWLDRKGREWHARNVGTEVNPKRQIMVSRSECTPIKKPGKHRYLMPLDDKMREQIKHLAKPYPKRKKQAMAVPSAQRRGSADLYAPKPKDSGEIFPTIKADAA